MGSYREGRMGESLFLFLSYKGVEFYYFIIYFNLTWENDLGLSLKLRYLTHKFIHKIVIKTHFPMILHYP